MHASGPQAKTIIIVMVVFIMSQHPKGQKTYPNLE